MSLPGSGLLFPASESMGEAFAAGLLGVAAGFAVGWLRRRKSGTGGLKGADPAAYSGPQPVVITDLQGRILNMTPPAIELLGEPAPGAKLQDRLAAGQREAFEAVLSEPAGKETWPAGQRAIETTALRPNGQAFAMECVLHRVFLGDRARLSIVVRDVSERKREESRIHQGRRMEALGRLAGGVAHDFNNVLTAIIGYAELLKAGLADRPALAAHADEILKAGGLAGGLTRQLLAFSRKQVVLPKIVHLNRILQDMSGMFRRIVREDIEIDTRLGEGLPAVEADPTQLQQVLLNLVVNAGEAMPQGGRIALRTSAVDVTPEEAACQPYAQPGPHVLLEVADTGSGMDKEIQAHVFEPFFSAKRGGGTGLGLATTYGIVRQARGHIRLASEPRRGTTFFVYLPASGGKETPEPVKAAEPARMGRGTILLVEDSPVILKLAGEALRREGYTILSAVDGQEAAELAGASGREIHLLATDLVLPRLGGFDLAKQLAESRPQLKVLFMSGYADSTLVNADLFRSESEFLGKPYTPSELCAKVRNVLDTGRPFRANRSVTGLRS